MKKVLLSIFISLFLYSCIPLRVAPKISNYSISKGNKFKRALPKRQMFIFEDKKEADDFYSYVNTKYQLNDENVYDDVPFSIDGKQYFFSFYETDIPDKHINLFPVIADVFLSAALGNDEVEPVFSQGTGGVKRSGNWYIAIEVYSDTEKDCLENTSFSRAVVLKYLSALKDEYLSTDNYNELVFKN